MVDVDLLHGLLFHFVSSALLLRDPLSCLNDDVGRFWKFNFVKLGVLAFSGEQSEWDRAWWLEWQISLTTEDSWSH